MYSYKIFIISALLISCWVFVSECNEERREERRDERRDEHRDEQRDERRNMVKRWDVNQEREVNDRPILNLRAKREWGEGREGRREEGREGRREEGRGGRRGEEFNRERGWGR